MSRLDERPREGQRQAERLSLVAACHIGSLTVVAYLVVSRVFYADFGIEPIIPADRLVLLILVAGFILLGRLAARIDPRVTLAWFTVLAMLGAGLIGLPRFGVDIESRVRSALSPLKESLFAILFQTHQPEGLYRLDDRYGWVHVPNVSASERGRSFTADYTIDADGHRLIPSPDVARGTVVFLGDSFTFGEGVSNDETFSYLLATEYWTDLRLINAGVGGWGLTQFHLKLTDLLGAPPFPNAVVLGIIPHDLQRSYLRPPLAPEAERRLEWIGGRFVAQRLEDRRWVADHTADLLEEEVHQANSTLLAMAAAARAKGVAFTVVLLDDGTYPPSMVYELGRAAVPLLDLTRLELSWLPYNGHPDPAAHRRIAAAIASSFLTRLVHRSGPESNGEGLTR